MRRFDLESSRGSSSAGDCRKWKSLKGESDISHFDFRLCLWKHAAEVSMEELLPAWIGGPFNATAASHGPFSFSLS
jgi:hypothetical protein